MHSTTKASMTRPLVHAYVRTHLLMTAPELVSLKDQLRTFATAEGFTLGEVFTEQPHTAPAAFHALLAAVERDEATTVVVPTRRHLGVLGHPEVVERLIERQTGAHVLVADLAS